MSETRRQPWPEVDPPKGWKKNPKAGRRLTWILLLTVIVAGGVTALSAGKSEVLPVICFLALVALPFVGPVVSRIGYGANDREARELHTVTEAEMTVEAVDGAGRMTRFRAPHQKIVIPGEMKGVPVTAAADGLFQGNRVLAFVHLPEGLQEVSARMFEGCDNLPAIVLPPEVGRIGTRAFAGCSELRDVYIPASVTEIAPDAFEGCTNLILHVRAGSAAEGYAREKDMLFANR